MAVFFSRTTPKTTFPLRFTVLRNFRRIVIVKTILDLENGYYLAAYYYEYYISNLNIYK